MTPVPHSPAVWKCCRVKEIPKEASSLDAFSSVAIPIPNGYIETFLLGFFCVFLGSFTLKVKKASWASLVPVLLRIQWVSLIL